MKMKRVLDEKIRRGHEPINAIPGNASIRDAAVQMARLKIGAMLVRNPELDDHYDGIVTERDIIMAFSRYDDLDRVTVNEIMTREMITADAEDNVQPVVQLMTRRHFRHIPLMENGVIVALISIRDLMHCLDEEKDITINELSDYICSNSRNQVY